VEAGVAEAVGVRVLVGVVAVIVIVAVGTVLVVVIVVSHAASPLAVILRPKAEGPHT
jgi:hypothetical protein